MRKIMHFTASFTPRQTVEERGARRLRIKAAHGSPNNHVRSVSGVKHILFPRHRVSSRESRTMMLVLAGFFSRTMRAVPGRKLPGAVGPTIRPPSLKAKPAHTRIG